MWVAGNRGGWGIIYGHETGRLQFTYVYLSDDPKLQSTNAKSPLIPNIKVMWSRYRPGVAQRVGRGIALLFHDRGTRMRWVVSSTPRPHFTPGKNRVPIVQEAGWAPGPVWTSRKSRPHRNSILDRPSRSSVVIPTELPGPYIYI